MMPAVQTKPKSMKIAEIRKKAQSLGVEPGKIKKAELIHTIQLAEHYTPCFGTSNGECGNVECCFLVDCVNVK